MTVLRRAFRRFGLDSNLQEITSEIAEAPGAELDALRAHAVLAHAPQRLASYPAKAGGFFLGEDSITGLKPDRWERL